MEMHSRSSSLGDWESVRDEDAAEEESCSRRSDDQAERVVLELPPEGIVGVIGAQSAVAAEASTAEVHSAAGSSLSSFIPVSGFTDMNVASVPSSVSSYQYQPFNHNGNGDDDLSSTLSNNFEIISLSSGDVVRRCRRCHFHNPHDAVVCASCDLALVANPDVDADAQIAVHLQQKEEADARARLQEEERRRRTRPFYDHACILANDVRGVQRHIMGPFFSLPADDLVELALPFVQTVMDRTDLREIQFVHKCTTHASLESIRGHGLPADRPVGEAATDVELSCTLEDAFTSFEARRTRSGELLHAIPENAEDGAEKPKPCCLCWIVAVLKSVNAGDVNAFPPAQTLPLAYFDSSYADGDDDHEGKLERLLGGLRRVFTTFFVENLQLLMAVAEPPRKRAEGGLVELMQQNTWHQMGGNGVNDDELQRNIGIATPLRDGAVNPQGLRANGDTAEPSTAQLDAGDSSNCHHLLGDDGSDDSRATFSSSENGKSTALEEGDDYALAATTPLSAAEHVTAYTVFGNGLAIVAYPNILLWFRECGVYKELQGAGHQVVCIASYHGEMLATASAVGGVKVHRLRANEDGEIADDDILVLDSGSNMQIRDLCFLPKGHAVAATNMMRECRLWSVVDGSCICSLKGERPEMAYSIHETHQKLQVCRFSHDGNGLASVADGSPSIHFWDLYKCTTRMLSGHESAPDLMGRPAFNIRALSFSPDGKYLASAANDCTIRVWDLQHLSCINVIRVPNAIGTLDFSPNSTLLAGGCINGEIRVWEPLAKSSEALRRVIRGGKGSIRTVMFLPDGQALASIGWSDSSLRIWDL